MSAYLHIVGSLRGVAENLLPGAKFVHGSYDELTNYDIQTADQAPPALVVKLFSGFVFNAAEIDSATRRTTVTLEFGFLDEFDADSVKQDNLLASAHVLVDQFLEALNGIAVGNGIQITSPRIAPFYKYGIATRSGLAVELTIDVPVCYPAGALLNQYPDLAEYMNEVGRDINPLDWQGITRRE